MSSLSGHQSAVMKNDEWLTPLEILKPLGVFDLDPCAPVVRPWDTAKRHYTKFDDGLNKPREPITTRVWLNPPFGSQWPKWLLRWGVEHGNTIALIPARTETRQFFKMVWDCEGADAICFLRKRPHFHFVDGTRAPFNSGAPICLIAYGKINAVALRRVGLGKTLTLR